MDTDAHDSGIVIAHGHSAAGHVANVLFAKEDAALEVTWRGHDLHLPHEPGLVRDHDHGDAGERHGHPDLETVQVLLSVLLMRMTSVNYAC